MPKSVENLNRSFFAIFLLLILEFPVDAHPYDIPVAIADQPVIDMFISPSGHGWIVASDGKAEFLFRTDDAGRHWSKQLLNFPVSNIYFLDSYRGWGVAMKSEKYSLITTSDGGVTWATVCPITEIDSRSTIINGLFFADGNKGWILGSQARGLSVVLAVNTFGSEVKKISPLSGVALPASAIFKDPESEEIWIIGNDSILSSSDLGSSWRSVVSLDNLPEKRRAISFTAGQAIGDGIVFAAGESAGGVVFKTTDYGQRWNLVLEAPESHGFQAIQFWDQSHGCAVGGSTLLVCTTDAGKTWSKRKVLPKSEKGTVFMDNVFTKIFFVENGHRGWTLADGGFLFQSDDGGNSWRPLDLFAVASLP